MGSSAEGPALGTLRYLSIPWVPPHHHVTRWTVHCSRASTANKCCKQVPNPSPSRSRCSAVCPTVYCDLPSSCTTKYQLQCLQAQPTAAPAAAPPAAPRRAPPRPRTIPHSDRAPADTIPGDGLGDRRPRRHSADPTAPVVEPRRRPRTAACGSRRARIGVRRERLVARGRSPLWQLERAACCGQCSRRRSWPRPHSPGR